MVLLFINNLFFNIKETILQGFTLASFFLVLQRYKEKHGLPNNPC